jgi:hypothetical protein
MPHADWRLTTSAPRSSGAPANPPSTGIAGISVPRAVHQRGIQQHFAAHLDKQDIASMTRGLEKVLQHVRPLRPGRISA